jgi:hypothetical protein
VDQAQRDRFLENIVPTLSCGCASWRLGIFEILGIVTLQRLAVGVV